MRNARLLASVILAVVVVSVGTCAASDSMGSTARPMLHAAQSPGLLDQGKPGETKPTAPAKPDQASPKAGDPVSPKPADVSPKPVQAPPTSDADQPEDFKAFNEASNAKGSQERIDALQAFREKYPDSSLRNLAFSDIVSEIARSVGQQTKTLVTLFEKEGQAGIPSIDTVSGPLSDLVRAGVLLDEAQALAEKALADNADPQRYLSAEREVMAKAKAADKRPAGGMSFSGDKDGRTTVKWVPAREPGPATVAGGSQPSKPVDPDSRYLQVYRIRRALVQSALGQIYLKRGRTADAEKMLTEAYRAPELSAYERKTVVVELARLAKKSGNDQAALDYLADAVVAGAKPEIHAELNEVYRKLHSGSLDGLDALLDERYRKSLPAIETKPFARPKTAEPRLVLAELFTGSECPPCVGIDLALDAALQRYAPDDLALLVYHEHIPGPDPITNPSAEKRLEFYGARGMPTYYVDGRLEGVGGAGADQAERFLTSRFIPAFEKAMGTKPEASLRLEESVKGQVIKVKAGVSRLGSASKKLRLQLALVEEQVRYQGGNGVRFHSMVVRSLAGTNASGFPVPIGKPMNVEWTFDVPKIVAEHRKAIDEFLSKPFRGGDKKPTLSKRMEDIDAAHLRVVAFVQDEEGDKADVAKPGQPVARRQVLQAAWIKVK